MCHHCHQKKCKCERKKIPIRSLPYTIEKSGCYILCQDFEYDLEDVSAITIQNTENVELDFNKYTITATLQKDNASPAVSVNNSENVELNNININININSFQNYRGIVINSCKKIFINNIYITTDTFPEGVDNQSLSINETDDINGQNLYLSSLIFTTCNHILSEQLQVDNLEIDNCSRVNIINSTMEGCAIGGCDGVNFSNNVVNDGITISLIILDEPIFCKNVNIFDNTIKFSRFLLTANNVRLENNLMIVLDEEGLLSLGIDINNSTNCTFKNNSLFGTDSEVAVGITVDNASEYNLIEGNHIGGFSKGNGILLTNSDCTVVRNNVLINNKININIQPPASGNIIVDNLEGCTVSQ